MTQFEGSLHDYTDVYGRVSLPHDHVKFTQANLLSGCCSLLTAIVSPVLMHSFAGRALGSETMTLEEHFNICVRYEAGRVRPLGERSSTNDIRIRSVRSYLILRSLFVTAEYHRVYVQT